jgi:hypothetical protein
MLFRKVKAAALVLAMVSLAISGGLLTHGLLAAQRSSEASTADAAPRDKARTGAGKGVKGRPARPSQPSRRCLPG